MTTIFIVSYIILALTVVGATNLFLIRSRKKGKRQQKEQQLTTCRSNQPKSKTNDLGKTTNQSTQHITHEELRVDSQDDHSQASLDGYTEGSGRDQEIFTNNKDEEAAAAKNPESEEYKVNEKMKKEHKNSIFGKGVSRDKISAVLLFGMFIAILNQTLLNVALSEINTEFDISASTGQWSIAGFMLVNDILIPVMAHLFNKYSCRKLFLAALVFFTTDSLICAILMNFPIMTVGRILQAIDVDALMSLGSIVVITIYPPEGRGAAMSTVGTTMILAPAIGPTLSGYIVQNYHQNVVFYDMLIIGIIAISIGFVWFKLYQYTTNPRANIPDIIFSTIGFGTLLYSFSEADNKDWSSVGIETMFAIGIIFIILLVIEELRMKSPTLNLEVLKFLTFTLTTTINMVIMLSLYGDMILLPIYLQNLCGSSALDSELLLLPGSLIMGLLGPSAGKLLDTIGLKPLAIFGVAVMIYATWELAKLNMDIPYITIMGIHIPRSFGMAFIVTPMITTAINALPGRLASRGNAFLSTMRQLAGSIGTAILVAIMITQTAQHLSAFGEELDRTNPVAQSHMRELVSQHGGQKGAVKVLLQFVNKLTTVRDINDAFIVATIFNIIALILYLLLQSNRKAKATARELDTDNNINHK